MKSQKAHLALLTLLLILTPTIFGKGKPVDHEYIGHLDTNLYANTEDFERVIFKYVPSETITSFNEETHKSRGLLYNPQTGRATIRCQLEEDANKSPVVTVDLDGNGALSDSERLTLAKTNNPYIWDVTIKMPLKNGFFKTYAIYLRYFKSYTASKMTADDRLITQSTEVFAGGEVDVKNKNISLRYNYDFSDQTIKPQNGWVGMDGNEDGKVDMNRLSWEAAKADDESIIFRVGDLYLSTKKVDISKNQIVLSEHDAKEYQRLELEIDKEFPDFSFLDFDGKKHSFVAEFRGKYVLVDIWGFWCPACRQEIPYLREAYNRFKGRNLAVLGLNTDVNFEPNDFKTALEKGQIYWTQAQIKSIFELINKKLRIESFPTTFLISPDGKLLSMSRSDHDEPDLRGADLLTTLDKVLPKR